MRPAIFFALLLTACHSPRVLIVPDGSDAASYDGDGGDVGSRVCVHVHALGCPEGDSPRCAQAVNIDQAQGVGAQLDVACLLSAASCDAVTACGRR